MNFFIQKFNFDQKSHFQKLEESENDDATVSYFKRYTREEDVFKCVLMDNVINSTVFDCISPLCALLAVFLDKKFR